MQRQRTYPTLLLGLAVMALLAFNLACGRGEAGQRGQRVIVLGFDGMDYRMTKELMAQGKLPNFSRLAAEGTFTHLGTSAPPIQCARRANSRPKGRQLTDTDTP